MSGENMVQHESEIRAEQHPTFEQLQSHLDGLTERFSGLSIEHTTAGLLPSRFAIVNIPYGYVKIGTSDDPTRMPHPSIEQIKLRRKVAVRNPGGYNTGGTYELERAKPSPEYESTRLVFHRTDGIEIEFSFNHAIGDTHFQVTHKIEGGQKISHDIQLETDGSVSLRDRNIMGSDDTPGRKGWPKIVGVAKGADILTPDLQEAIIAAIMMDHDKAPEKEA